MKEIWKPIVVKSKDYIAYCDPTFWGMDERKIDGKTTTGFFVDIETYDEKSSLSLFFPIPVYGIRWTDEAGRNNMDVDLSENNPAWGSTLVQFLTINLH